MADKKISALTGASTPLAGTEVLPIVQSGATVKVAVSDLTVGRAVSVLSLTSTNSSTIAGMNVGLGGGSNSTNTAVGYTAINANASAGGYCVGFGYAALKKVTSGIYNSASGFDCLSGITTGSSNTAMGGASGSSLTSGSNNAFWGYNSQGSSAGVSNEYTYGDASVTSHRFTGGNLVPVTAAKGINFTANTPAAGMTSQLLNWYEEGTWTPVPTGLTVVGTPTYTGKYTRIGRQVTCIATIDSTTSTAAAAGVTSFSGLPFTAAAISGNNAGNGTTVDTNTLTQIGSGYIFSANNKFYVTGWTATPNIVMSFVFYTS